MSSLSYRIKRNLLKKAREQDDLVTKDRSSSGSQLDDVLLLSTNEQFPPSDEEEDSLEDDFYHQRPPEIESEDELPDTRVFISREAAEEYAQPCCSNLGIQSSPDKTHNDPAWEPDESEDECPRPRRQRPATPPPLPSIEDERKWLRYKVESLTREQCILFCAIGHMIFTEEEMYGTRSDVPTSDHARQALLCLAVGEQWDLMNLSLIVNFGDKVDEMLQSLGHYPLMEWMYGSRDALNNFIMAHVTLINTTRARPGVSIPLPSI